MPKNTKNYEFCIKNSHLKISDLDIKVARNYGKKLREIWIPFIK